MPRPPRPASAAWLLASILCGCPGSPPGGTSALLGEPVPPAPPTSAAPIVAPPAPTAEAVVLGAARALEQGAVEQARAVQGRLLEASTKELAAGLLASHGAALEKLVAIEKELGVAGAESATKAEVDRELAALADRLENTLEGDLDRVYRETQAKLHKGALEVIDRQLLPLAKTDRLVAALREMRGIALRHVLGAQGASGQGAGEAPAGH